MSTEKQIFTTKIKYTGVFSLKDLYRFCYDWLKDEVNLSIVERKYDEKIGGNAKNLIIEWEGKRKITDYFRNVVKVTIKVYNMEDVEAMQGSAKVKANKGQFEISVKGLLERDYEGKWEVSAWAKFWRGVYEKYVIPATVKEYEDKLEDECYEFADQVKAYLALEGER